MKKVNEKNVKWEIPAHEDPRNPGTLKRVIVKQEEVDPQSKLMMVNLAKVKPGRVHPAHSHPTMEEIFLFQEGRGEIKINTEVSPVGPGDRVIVPAKSQHEIRNLGKNELKFIGIGIALD